MEHRDSWNRTRTLSTKENFNMTRPITLCTGQWANLPLETLAAKAKEFGFDGLELACSGDHFEVARAAAESEIGRASCRERVSRCV